MSDGIANAFGRFDWMTLRARLAGLLDEDLGAADVPDWLRRWSALEKEVREAFVVRHRATNADAADKEAEAAYLDFVTQVRPEAQALTQRLQAKLLGVKGFTPEAEHVEMLRRLRNQAELFREENVALQAEVAALAKRLGQMQAARTVVVAGEEMGFAQAYRRLDDPDRTVREQAFLAVFGSERDAEHDEIFLHALGLLRQMAKNAGFGDYRAYRWRQLGRFDYTPEDAQSFHRAVEASVIPLLTRLHETRKAALGVERLRPWDLFVDPGASAPLRPFASARELGAAMIQVFAALDDEFGVRFKALFEDGRFDVSDKFNRDMLYCSHYPLTGRAYVLWQGSGDGGDVRLALHEVGHAFHHELSCAHQDLVWNRPVPLESADPINMEFNELASQAMELLGHEVLAKEEGGFYTADEVARSKRKVLESVPRIISAICRLDAFQHWLFAEAPENVTAADIDAAYLSISKRFNVGADWQGLESIQARFWRQATPRVISLPFYSIEYALAWLGALQVWQNAREDRAEALRSYKQALSLGYTRPLPDLYAAAGARFAFDEASVGKAIAFLEERLEA